MTDKTKFIDYLMDFYGPSGIYPLGFTRTQIQLATSLYITTGREFLGDTRDRERVRDIVLAATESYLTV